MFRTKLRLKITAGALGLVILIMTLSTIIISLIIYDQNRDASFSRVDQSMKLIQDDLLNMGVKLLNHTKQIANTETLASSIEFIKMMDPTQELDSTGKATYQEIAASLHTIARTANLARTAVYSETGNLIAFVSMEEGQTTIGYPLRTGFDVIVLKRGENIQSDMWKVAEINAVFSKRFQQPVPAVEKTQFEESADEVALTTYAPIIASVYDQQADKFKEAQIGFVTAVYPIASGFVDRLNKLTGVEINVFGEKGLLSGSNPDYKSVNIDQFKPDKKDWSILDQEVFLSDVKINSETFFQGILPLFSDGGTIGAIAILISSGEAMRNTWQIIKILCFVSIGSIVIVLPLSFMIANRVTKPLELLSQTMSTVKETGSFSRRVPVVSVDETGVISQSFNDLMDSFQMAIEQINRTMASVANGDLSQGIEGDFKGETKELQKNTNESINILSQVIDRVLKASTQVNLGAEELSRSSQSLASGTSEQAATLEQISSSMNEIGSQSKINSEKANNAKEITEETLTIVKEGNDQMQHMLLSMKQINETSNEVSKIIKVIDEIAFQTNLLALNAAVEAARAGKYGKGFAVVAEEVRNLAARSAEAAKNTTGLIESSLKEVDKGVINADKTAEILTQITSGIEKSNGLVSEISSASKDQVAAVVEINNGLHQVNNVIQQNSSISEQSASASQELSELATKLKKQLNRFRIKDQTILLESGEEIEV
ncbi:HAMP domain-containing protein [bacterium]|nr:HAMP domain-containing protein [bacterium]